MQLIVGPVDVGVLEPEERETASRTSWGSCVSRRDRDRPADAPGRSDRRGPTDDGKCISDRLPVVRVEFPDIPDGPERRLGRTGKSRATHARIHLQATNVLVAHLLEHPAGQRAAVAGRAIEAHGIGRIRREIGDRLLEEAAGDDGRSTNDADGEFVRFPEVDHEPAVTEEGLAGIGIDLGHEVPRGVAQ